MPPRPFARGVIIGTLAVVGLAAVIAIVVAVVSTKLGGCHASNAHADPVRAEHAKRFREAMWRSRAVALAGAATVAVGIAVAAGAYVDVRAVALVAAATGLTCATLAGDVAVHTNWVSSTVARGEQLCSGDMVAKATFAGALLLLAAGVLLSAAGPLLGRRGDRKTVVTFAIAANREWWFWARVAFLGAAVISAVVGVALTAVDDRGALEAHVVPGVTEAFPIAIDTGGRADVEHMYVRGQTVVAFAAALLLLVEVGAGAMVRWGGKGLESKEVAGVAGAVVVGLRAVTFFVCGALLALFASPLIAHALAVKGERVRMGPHACVVACVVALGGSVVTAAVGGSVVTAAVGVGRGREE